MSKKPLAVIYCIISMPKEIAKKISSVKITPLFLKKYAIGINTIIFRINCHNDSESVVSSCKDAIKLNFISLMEELRP